MRKDRIKPAKLAEAIASHLESLILEGSLRSGERLLAERELAQRLDVSRPSLREALSLLEERGLLESSRNGSVVAPLLGEDFSGPLLAMAAEDANFNQDYLEFRCIVEGQAAYLAALRATEVDRDVLNRCHDAMQAAHQRQIPEEEAQADAALHLAVYEASHNLMVLHVMGSLGDLLRRDVTTNRTRMFTRKGVRELLLQQHLAIYRAVAAGDPDAARNAAMGHVLFTRTALQEIDEADTRLEMNLRRWADGENRHE